MSDARGLSTRRVRWAFFSQMNAHPPTHAFVAPTHAPDADNFPTAWASASEQTLPAADSTLERAE